MPIKKYVMEDIQDHFRIELEEAVFVLKEALEVNMSSEISKQDISKKQIEWALNNIDKEMAIFKLMTLGNAYLEAIEAIRKSSYLVGPWLSAALEDENVCDEMKSNIRDWFKLNAEILKKVPEDL